MLIRFYGNDFVEHPHRRPIQKRWKINNHFQCREICPNSFDVVLHDTHLQAISYTEKELRDLAQENTIRAKLNDPLNGELLIVFFRLSVIECDAIYIICNDQN